MERLMFGRSDGQAGYRGNSGSMPCQPVIRILIPAPELQWPG
jgi:hypothetical protein